MARIMVEVPDGHALQVHPPGLPNPHTGGMIPDPATAGAKQAMDSALPIPHEQKGSKTPQQPKRKTKPAVKKDGKDQERQMGADVKEKAAH